MTCDKCDFVSDTEDDFSFINGETLCDECFIEDYFVCDVCGQILETSDMSELETNVCNECHEE